MLDAISNSPGGIIAPSGELVVTHFKHMQPSWKWKLSNMLRKSWLTGSLGAALISLFGKPLRGMGLIVIQSELRLIHIDKNGKKTDYGVVSRHVVTDTGVAAIVDAFTNTYELETLNYHGSGTGTTAESASQTALVTESTTALNPDSTRPTGTQSQPSANIYRTVATATYDATAAITEHGVFDQAATGGGVMIDRSVFSAVNVVSGESIQFQYSLTFPSGS